MTVMSHGGRSIVMMTDEMTSHGGKFRRLLCSLLCPLIQM